jgi:protein-disulfide isomerase
VSLLLGWEYAQDVSGLCGPGGGCDQVRQSAYSELLGIPMPIFGAVLFAMLIGVTAAGPRAGRLLVLVAAAGAVGGIALIAVQLFVIEAMCPVCLVADVAAIVALPVALVAGGRVGFSGKARVTGAIASVAAGLLALVVGRAMSEPPPEPVAQSTIVDPLPEPIAREQKPGVVTIVEFLDFQCPHCRRLHAELSGVLEKQGEAVRVVRKHVPLDGHQYAMPAALCAICAEQQGKETAMADALFRADDISPAGCGKLAETLGVDRAALLACFDAESSIARIIADVEAAQASGVDGLPTFFIGNEKFSGFRPASALRDAIDRARQRQGL